jgi:hypothetical protein
MPALCYTRPLKFRVLVTWIDDSLVTETGYSLLIPLPALRGDVRLTVIRSPAIPGQMTTHPIPGHPEATAPLANRIGEDVHSMERIEGDSGDKIRSW